MHFSNDYKNVEATFLLLWNISHICQSHTEVTSGARGQTLVLVNVNGTGVYVWIEFVAVFFL